MIVAPLIQTQNVFAIMCAIARLLKWTGDYLRLSLELKCYGMLTLIVFNENDRPFNHGMQRCMKHYCQVT